MLSLRGLTFSSSRPEEFLRLGNVVRRIVREDQFVAPRGAALLRPRRHADVAQLGQECRCAFEGGPFLNRRDSTIAQSIHVFN